MLQIHLEPFLPQAWNWPFLQGALIPFSGEWYLESKVWALGVLIATRVLLPAGPLSRQT